MVGWRWRADTKIAIRVAANQPAVPQVSEAIGAPVTTRDVQVRSASRDLARKPAAERTLNTAGTGSPLLLVRANLVMQELAVGEVIEIIATHPDSATDIPGWCHHSGNTLVHSEVHDSTYRYYVRKRA